MSEWRPIILTEKATGRSIHITIFDRELYKSGFFTFEDLWEMYAEAELPGNGTEAGGDDDDR